MSKADAQRAMREANYARNQASGPSRREAAADQATPTVPAASKSKANPARAAKAAPSAASPQGEGERCGHKSMNGRSCTREAAHSEKSHRYS